MRVSARVCGTKSNIIYSTTLLTVQAHKDAGWFANPAKWENIQSFTVPTKANIKEISEVMLKDAVNVIKMNWNTLRYKQVKIVLSTLVERNIVIEDLANYTPRLDKVIKTLNKIKKGWLL